MGDELKGCSLKAQMVFGSGFGEGILKNEQKKVFLFFYMLIFHIFVITPQCFNYEKSNKFVSSPFLSSLFL
jgi:hypothetical protein